MRAFVIATLFASASAVKLNAEWPSVAKCGEGQNGAVSSDDFACDHNSKNPTVVDGSVTDHRFQYANPGYETQVQTSAQWPSVARCDSRQTESTDEFACDDNNVNPKPHDGSVVQTAEQIVNSWPSVARCGTRQDESTDEFACDGNNVNPHPHDGSVVQTAEQVVFRPPIKCKDPVFGNPVSCDDDDIGARNEENPKNAMGETEVKVIVGGPSAVGN